MEFRFVFWRQREEYEKQKQGKELNRLAQGNMLTLTSRRLSLREEKQNWEAERKGESERSKKLTLVTVGLPRMGRLSRYAGSG